MENPSSWHLASEKCILRYLKGTLTLGLRYKEGKILPLEGYSDSDYGGDLEDRKSTSGVFFFLGRNLVTWMIQKQRIIVLYSFEAKHVSLILAACQGIWLARLVKELTKKNLKLHKIFVNYKSAIDLAKNPEFHNQSKHIKIQYHFFRA